MTPVSRSVSRSSKAPPSDEMSPPPKSARTSREPSMGKSRYAGLHSVVIGLPWSGAVDGCRNSTYDTQGSPMPFPGEKFGLVDRGTAGLTSIRGHTFGNPSGAGPAAGARVADNPGHLRVVRPRAGNV